MENQEQEILSVEVSGGKKTSRIFFTLFFIAIAALTAWTGFELQIKGASEMICVFIASAVLVFGAAAIVFFRNEKMAVHRQFALLFAVFGFLYFLLVPFLSKNDERQHFLRAFEITRGHFISDQIPGTRYGGQRLPENIIPKNLDDYPYANTTLLSYKTLLENADERLNENELAWRNFLNSAMYPPFTYALHLPGIMIAKSLTDKSLFMGYAARLSAFILAWLFLFLAIKKTPYKQKTLLVLSLAPVFLYQATAVSGDALINLVTLLSIATALILACSQDEYKVSSKALILIALLAFFATLGKIIYFPIALVFLLIPSSKFESPKQWKIFFIVLFGICILSDSGWVLSWKLHIATDKMTVAATVGDISSAISTLANSNTALQIQAILKNPGEFLKVILETLIIGNKNIIFEIFTDSFGHEAVSIDKIVGALYIFSIIAVSFSDKYGSRVSYKRLFFVFLIAALLIPIGIIGVYGKNHITAIGVFLESINAAKVEGLPAACGRYLFPSAALILMCLNFKRIKLNSDLIFRYCLPIICFVNLFVLSKFVLHFAR